jgi:molecular chaperone GrpE
MEKKIDRAVPENQDVAAGAGVPPGTNSGKEQKPPRQTSPSHADSSCPPAGKEVKPERNVCAPRELESVQIGKIELETLRQKAQEAESWLNTLKRVKADFDNYQKRIEREKEENQKYLAQSVLCDILPILDNLERAVASLATAKNLEAVSGGLKAIHMELLRMLERHSVRPIESCGKPFDPACHEAVCCEETADCVDSTVIEELARGYRLHDRVLRPAQVKVAKRRTQD